MKCIRDKRHRCHLQSNVELIDGKLHIKKECADCHYGETPLPIIHEADSFYAEYCREFSGAGAEE